MPSTRSKAILILTAALVAGLLSALCLAGCLPEVTPTVTPSAGHGPDTTRTSASTSPSAHSSSTISESSSTTGGVSDTARAMLADAIAQAEKQSMKAVMQSLLGARTEFFYDTRGWTAQVVPERPEPGEGRAVPHAGRSGDAFFWLTSFEGEQAVVSASLDEMERLWHDPAVCRQETEQGLRLMVQMLVSNPLEQLKHLRLTEEPQELTGGGWRLKGTLRLFDIVRDVVAPFDDRDRLVEDPYDVYEAPTTVTLEVDASGAPVRSVFQMEAMVEGQRVQPFEARWTPSDTQPPLLPEGALSLSRVVAEPWPTGWMPSYTLAPPQPTVASLTAYKRQQREYLSLALRELGHAEMRGLVTFTEPLDDPEALAIVGTRSLRREYLEWVTTDGTHGSTSGCVARTAEDIRKILYPQKPAGYVRLVAVGLIGAHRDYPMIADDPAVLLVDLGPVPTLIPLIKKAESVIGQPTRDIYQLWKQAGSPAMP